MSTIPTMSTVLIHGLGKNPQLNNRLAVVLRPSSNDPSRLVVYILPAGQEPSCVVRIKHQNLCLQTSSAVPALSSAPDNPPPPKKNALLPLSAPVLEMMPDTAHPPFLYAFGNTTPVYVLPGIGFTEEEPARVLLLAAGDLRSALYSLARDHTTLCATKDSGKSKSKPASTKPLLLFTFNDMSVEVTARNIVILWLLHQTSVSVKSILDIWFCLRFDSAALTALLDAMHALTGPDATALLEEIGVRLSDGTDLRVIQATISRWLSWVGVQKWSEVLRARHNCLKKNIKGSIDSIVEGISSVMKLKYLTVKDNDFPFKSAEKEMEMLVREGRFDYSLHNGQSDTSEDSLFVNPTLFLNPHEYHLHYGSIPHEAFPSFADSYDPHHPLLTLALTSISDWRNGILKTKGLVNWEFDVGDCLAFLSSFPSTMNSALAGPKYDVIATSNVADQLGLLPLLLACRPAVKDNGILLTQSLRYSSYSSTQDEYLQKNLVISPDRYASVLGWHCCGYEGNGLEALPGGVITHMPSVAEVSTSVSQKNTENSGSRVELNLVWKPSFSCFGGETYGNFVEQGAKNSQQTLNTFLCLENDEQVQELTNFLEPELPEYPLSLLADYMGRHAINPVKQSRFNRSHSMTFLPILLKCKSVEEVERLLKTPHNDELDPFGEVRDVASAILRGRAKEELEVASVKMPLHSFKVMFESVKQTVSSMMLTMLVSTNRGKIPFSGIQMEIIEEGKMFCKLSWVWKKNCVIAGRQERNPIVLLGSGFYLADFSLSDIEVVSLDQMYSCLPSWVQSFIDNGIILKETQSLIAHDLEAELRDDGLEWNVNIALHGNNRSDRNIHPEMADMRIRRLQTKSAYMSRWELYGSKHQQSKLKLSPFVLAFPGPVKSCEITMDKENQVLRVCGIKDCYDLRFSMGIPRFSLQDSVAFPKISSTGVDYMGTICGCQFSSEERFQSRSRDTIDCPPVPSVKDTLTGMFQLSSCDIVEFGVKGEDEQLDIRIIGINHGILRNHCNGTPILDISLCVLDLSFMYELGKWLGPKRFDSKTRINAITMNLAELDLFKHLLSEVWIEQCKNCRSDTTDLLRTQHGAPANVSRHFKRVLIPPLLSPVILQKMSDSIMKKDKLVGGGNTLIGQLMKRKSRGKKFVSECKWTEAIKEYSLALRAVYEMAPERNVASACGAEVTRLAAECWLNLAHCHLQRTDNLAASRNKWALDSMKEVCICCDSAFELLNNQLSFFDGMNGLKMKAKFRKGLAMSRKGSTSEARTLFQQALQLKPDPSIEQALSELKF